MSKSPFLAPKITCGLCGGMDGKVIPLAQYEPGVTVPPFHPNCRGTTCPHYEDMKGERIARNADGDVYYVPENMDLCQYFGQKKLKDYTAFFSCSSSFC